MYILNDCMKPEQVDSDWVPNILDFNLLKPTGYVMHQRVKHSTVVRSAHNVFMCFVFIWEQTAISATYSINWLVL